MALALYTRAAAARGDPHAHALPYAYAEAQTYRKTLRNGVKPPPLLERYDGGAEELCLSSSAPPSRFILLFVSLRLQGMR